MSIIDILIRTLLAVAFGALVGREREIHNRPAGIRTHALVCLGAAVISMIQVEIIENVHNTIISSPEMKGVLTVNSGRIVAQVISGIGFLGAGTILVTKDKVMGLTTAASLWVVACVGIAIGYGYYEIAVISGVTVPLVLVGLKKLERSVTKRSHHANIIVSFECEGDYISKIMKYFKKERIHVKEIRTLNSNDEKGETQIEFMVYCRHVKSWAHILDKIEQIETVIEARRR